MIKTIRNIPDGLIEGVKQGNTGKTAALIAMIYPYVQNEAAFLLGSRGRPFVQDAAQDAVLALMKRINEIQNDRDLFRLIRKAVFEAAAVQDHVVFGQTVKTKQNNDPVQDKQEFLPGLLDELDLNARRILAMTYLDGMSTSKIAKELALGKTDVRRLLAESEQKIINKAAEECGVADMMELVGDALARFLHQLMRTYTYTPPVCGTEQALPAFFRYV